jgi:hypothetical protein
LHGSDHERIGHALLNFLAIGAGFVRRCDAPSAMRENRLTGIQGRIQQLRSVQRAFPEIAAVQRGWRDFRIATSSFERADPCCQKIGRRRLSRFS